MRDELAIQTQGLVKYYGEVQALRGVDLDVRRGEIFGFLGPNGAGKTTTIRCMLDLIRPQAGTIRVLGMDPQGTPVEVRARVGYLPGELNMESNLKAEDQLHYFADLRGDKCDWGFVRQLAERLELDLKIRIKNLSKGNKQKVGVIQSLMSRPELLLMDEPTVGLDPLMQQEVYRLLREAQSDGATIFFSSHIIKEVEALADRVAIIRQGVIVEEASPGQLINFEMRRVHVHFRGQIDPGPIIQMEGVKLLSQSNDLHFHFQVEGEMDHFIKALAEFPVVDLDVEHPSLEEVFLAYYAADEKEGG